MKKTIINPTLLQGAHVAMAGQNEDMNHHSRTAASSESSLIDLLYDGFYIVFLMRNGYVPRQADVFKKNILSLLERFEQQAHKLKINNEMIEHAKYAYCALLDETIVSQKDARYLQLQNIWFIQPLQLDLFGSQLAGDRFFDLLEQLRAQGKPQLANIALFHYCLLLGFQGKYRLQPAENLNHLVARIGDEIDYLKAYKAPFAPYALLPDKIKNIIHHELPFTWILLCILLFCIFSFGCLTFMLSRQAQGTISTYQNIIQAPAEQAHITIHLP